MFFRNVEESMKDYYYYFFGGGIGWEVFYFLFLGVGEVEEESQKCRELRKRWKWRYLLWGKVLVAMKRIADLRESTDKEEFKQNLTLQSSINITSN